MLVCVCVCVFSVGGDREKWILDEFLAGINS